MITDAMKTKAKNKMLHRAIAFNQARGRALNGTDNGWNKYHSKGKGFLHASKPRRPESKPSKGWAEKLRQERRIDESKKRK